MNYKMIAKKSVRVLREEGIGMLFRKGYLFLKSVAKGNNTRLSTEDALNCYTDVLFINGCYLDHPSRYRVSHQREQLLAAGISSKEVFYTDIKLEMVNNYRLFIFFRCPYTETIGEFIKRAKGFNKKVLFDIDDLVIDTKYTDNIPHIKEMGDIERRQYDEGVDAIGRTLTLCDGAITTTEVLAKELRNYVPEVYINRNVASETMIKLSEKSIVNKTGNNVLKLGYFSGSITHNADFEIIIPVIIRLLEEFDNVKIMLVGELSIPQKLSRWSDRIIISPMVNWKKLPELISMVDVNLAPLNNGVFNEAKSENKWVEAALVKVVTVASDIGAFSTMIKNKETGILCDNTEADWYNNLKEVIVNAEYRELIAEKAYKEVRKRNSTIYTAARFGNYITQIMTPNIVWLLPVIQISGGALVAFKHASIMQKRGYDVTIFNFGYEKTSEVYHEGCMLPVVSIKNNKIEGFIDKCVATLWTTCEFFSYYGKIKQKFYLVQNFETDFYNADEFFRIKANSTYSLRIPVKFITISRWCQKWLYDNYNKKAEYVPNGLQIDRFYPVERDYSGKIRILVEGNSDDYYKNVDESFEIVNRLNKNEYEIWFMSYQGKPKDWYYVDRFFHKVPYEDVPDIYRKCHILIKSSILESFSYPPLEMMSTGGCVVVAPNYGNIEYLEDNVNCLFYEQGDIDQAVEAIERIVSDNELRDKIVQEGMKTSLSRNWESIASDVAKIYE